MVGEVAMEAMRGRVLVVVRVLSQSRRRRIGGIWELGGGWVLVFCLFVFEWGEERRKEEKEKEKRKGEQRCVWICLWMYAYTHSP